MHCANHFVELVGIDRIVADLLMQHFEGSEGVNFLLRPFFAVAILLRRCGTHGLRTIGGATLRRSFSACSARPAAGELVTPVETR